MFLTPKATQKCTYNKIFEAIIKSEDWIFKCLKQFRRSIKMARRTVHVIQSGFAYIKFHPASLFLDIIKTIHPLDADTMSVLMRNIVNNLHTFA